MLINKFLYVQKKLHPFFVPENFNKYEKENFDVEFDMFNPRLTKGGCCNPPYGFSPVALKR